MPNEPKLFAVFGPDGKRCGFAESSISDAWWYVIESVHPGLGVNLAKRRLKRAGYKCREVRIVPVEEVGK